MTRAQAKQTELAEWATNCALRATQYTLPTADWESVCALEIHAAKAQADIHAANMALIDHVAKHSRDPEVIDRCGRTLRNLVEQMDRLPASIDQTDLLIIAEGCASGALLHLSTGLPVLVAS